MEELVYNILNPKLKILPNVEMDDVDFLKQQAFFITKGLFNIEIKFVEINHLYIT